MVFYIYDFTEPCAGKKCRILLIHRLIYQMLQHVLHIAFILEMMCHNEVSGIHKILTSLLFRIAWWTCSGNSKPFLPIFFFLFGLGLLGQLLTETCEFLSWAREKSPFKASACGGTVWSQALSIFNAQVWMAEISPIINDHIVV